MGKGLPLLYGMCFVLVCCSNGYWVHLRQEFLITT